MAEKQAKNSGRADHLKPHQFKPGESGNPGGRPKGRTISAELRKLVEDGHKGVDFAKAMAEVAAKYAAKGDFRFWNAILDRTEGPVTNKHEVSGDGIFNVTIGVVPTRDRSDEGSEE